MLIKKFHGKIITNDTPIGNCRIGRSVRRLVGVKDCPINEIPDGWEVELPVSVKMVAFDNDLPLFIHEVSVCWQGIEHPATIIGYHGIRTGLQPILQLNIAL